MHLALATLRGPREWRTLLILGRVSNLPTVWSNCLAGWWLGGGGTGRRFGLLCLGASCLYIAGMFLNDAFDAEFDRQHRKERPIPCGAISVGQVWGWGLGWLIAGVLLLSLLGKTPMVLALLLCASILLYDAIHKAITLSPVLMALCRWLLYLLGSATGLRGVTGLAVWGGLALAAYVIGLSYLARKESARGTVQSWACLPLAVPVLLAWVVNAGQYRLRAVMLSWLLVAWVIYCLRDTYWTRTVSVGRTVSGLLAGICLVDVVAVAGGTPLMTMTFLLLFVAALLLQRSIPAT